MTKQVKFIKSILMFIIINLICLVFLSCTKNNNPVVSTGLDSTLDSARFRWKTYQVGNYGYFNAGAWLRDTNDIFIVNNFFGFITRIQNDIITNISYTDFVPIQLVGYDKDNAYIFGYNRGEDSSICRIKEWNGNSFQDVSVNNNHAIRINRCLYYKPNEIWVAGYDNKIDKFDGTGLTHYQFNTNGFKNFDVEKIYYDSLAQKLRFVLLTEIHPPKNSALLYYIYEYDGNNWNKVAEFSNPIGSYTWTGYINGYILNESNYDIKIYLNNVFVPFLYPFDFIFNSDLNGYSKNNVLVSGVQPNRPYGNKYSLFNWNGEKWSEEYKQVSLSYPTIYSINNNVYLVVQDGLSTDVSTFLIGIKK